MKQIIKDVLDDMTNSQINLASEAARNMVSDLISAALKTKGSYKEYTDYELDEQEARASWVCSLCGENTFDVDSDYIGSGTNHLGCELESENDRKPYINDTVDETDKDKKVDWNDDLIIGIANEEKDFNQAVFGDSKDLTEARIQSDYKNKLSEEIVDNKDEKYIYESPDSGKTVYKRKVGGSKRELVKDWKKINVRK